MHPRPWRAPTGIVVELEEMDVPVGEGFQFSMLGPHDAEVRQLFAQLRTHAEADVARSYWEPNPNRRGSLLGGDLPGRPLARIRGRRGPGGRRSRWALGPGDRLALAFDRRDLHRRLLQRGGDQHGQRARLVAQLEAMGHRVTLEPQPDHPRNCRVRPDAEIVSPRPRCGPGSGSHDTSAPGDSNAIS